MQARYDRDQLAGVIRAAQERAKEHNLFNMRSERDIGFFDAMLSVTGKTGLTVCEVGSYMGQSAACMLATGRVDRIYCIDPWAKWYDKDDAASGTDMRIVESVFDAGIGLDSRVVKLRGNLDLFCNALTGVDVVYIDANHQYEPVKHDILTAILRMRPKVAVCGHDYPWPGVKKALNELLLPVDSYLGDGSWIRMLDNDSGKALVCDLESRYASEAY